ncbi:MAG: HAD hydrolase-like protein, partial [Firmicutes bacterium]|nr:HAD hydrolase-like protein [Bacillota bacterium]
MKAALFDMDGTLLHTEHVAIPAFRLTFAELKNRGLYSGDIPSEENFLHQLGNTLDMIWGAILPGSDTKTRLLADKIMLENEIRLIKSGSLFFYPGVKKTLFTLKERGYDIFVTSNGLEQYIDAIINHCDFGHLFTDLYSAGRFQTKSKVDLVAKLLKDYPITKGYMIGDRKSDVKAGNLNKLP